MRCPTCEKQIGWDWLEDECIEPNEEFECPHCGETILAYDMFIMRITLEQKFH